MKPLYQQFNFFKTKRETMINKKKPISPHETTHFLVRSFILILLFSVVIFSILGIYMTLKSERAVYQVGKIYMSGMNNEISRHFETVIDLRFEQVAEITDIVSDDESDQTQTEITNSELIRQAKIRGFNYVALCSTDGKFETLYGDAIQPKNSAPFVQALAEGKQRVAIGIDSAGNDVVLFGVDAAYRMKNGKRSTGLIAAVPISYVTNFLSLEDEEQNMYFEILRPDQSIVIETGSTEVSPVFALLRSQASSIDSYDDQMQNVETFQNCLTHRDQFTSTFTVQGEKWQIYGAALPNSEWYLVSAMPCSLLDTVINQLNWQRSLMTILSCAAVIALLTLIFIRYFSITQMHTQELEKARQKALAASQAKSVFLANMSHDIRTPMNAIVGMTAIALAHLNDQEQVRGCLKKISVSSKHLLGLINDVLDMSKIESGKLSLSIEMVSLKDLTDSVVSIMKNQVKTKNQTFNVQLENVTVENIWCDGVRLNQVLLNLLSNATKYTPENGAIFLSIREEPSSKGENYIRVQIRVKDNGIGMTPEFLTRIFESYSRADEGRVHRTEGAGLGMAITKYIVDAMQGTIEVNSEIGQGTEFCVTIDFEKADHEEEEMFLPPWKMLIVDDDELLCRSTIETLASMGVQADHALSAESALVRIEQQLIKNDSYQIIMLDWKLPGMDGIQLARKINKLYEHEIPILLISAYDWSEFEQEAREAGINDFIQKPLFKSTLYHALASFNQEDSCGRPVSSSHANQTLGSNTTQDPIGDIDEKIFRNRRILLAEDNELNWEVANELLSDLGAELEWAEDGQFAVERFEQSPPGYYDLILMDIRMPRMNGYEATKQIRSFERHDAKTIPIVAMSADAFFEDVQRSRDCGMNAHIAKPVDIDELIRILKRFFN